MTCPTDQPDPPQPGFRINEITLFTIIGPDDEEGIPAFLGVGDVWMPLIAADPHRLDDLRRIVAQRFPDEDVRERRFVPVEELDRIKREGVPGVMHKVDRAFYDHTVAQRDSAWREVERLREAKP